MFATGERAVKWALVMLSAIMILIFWKVDSGNALSTIPIPELIEKAKCDVRGKFASDGVDIFRLGRNVIARPCTAPGTGTRAVAQWQAYQKEPQKFLTRPIDELPLSFYRRHDGTIGGGLAQISSRSFKAIARYSVHAEIHFQKPAIMSGEHITSYTISVPTPEPFARSESSTTFWCDVSFASTQRYAPCHGYARSDSAFWHITVSFPVDPKGSERVNYREGLRDAFGALALHIIQQNAE